ncbi:YggT family protein [Collinsella intestinalis]|uniref:YggT family protein n=1 Tax=Collinsella intestinalis TaxID=147207 RepID=UPI00195A7603|nr:YggT family protein [Collinsella intestinalis]
MVTIYQIAQLISTLVNFYETLILVYIILTWFPLREGSFVYDVGMVLRSLCEPFLSLFRRIIPPMGGIDFSPVIAVLALNVIARLVIGILY